MKTRNRTDREESRSGDMGDPNDTVYVKEDTRAGCVPSYHDDRSCQYIRDHDVDEQTRNEAASKWYSACKKCVI